MNADDPLHTWAVVANDELPENAPEEARWAGALMEIMTRVFCLCPNNETQASLMVSFILTVLSNHSEPEQTWEQVRAVIDRELPKALREIRAHRKPMN